MAKTVICDRAAPIGTLQTQFCEKHREAYLEGGLCVGCDQERESPIVRVRAIEAESAREFRDILRQIVLQRTGEAIEGLAQFGTSDQLVKRDRTREQEIHDYMVDIEVARCAARMLWEITECSKAE